MSTLGYINTSAAANLANLAGAGAQLASSGIPLLGWERVEHAVHAIGGVLNRGPVLSGGDPTSLPVCGRFGDRGKMENYDGVERVRSLLKEARRSVEGGKPWNWLGGRDEGPLSNLAIEVHPFTTDLLGMGYLLRLWEISIGRNVDFEIDAGNFTQVIRRKYDTVRFDGQVEDRLASLIGAQKLKGEVTLTVSPDDAGYYIYDIGRVADILSGIPGCDLLPKGGEVLAGLLLNKDSEAIGLCAHEREEGLLEKLKGEDKASPHVGLALALSCVGLVQQRHRWGSRDGFVFTSARELFRPDLTRDSVDKEFFGESPGTGDEFSVRMEPAAAEPEIFNPPALKLSVHREPDSRWDYPSIVQQAIADVTSSIARAFEAELPESRE